MREGEERDSGMREWRKRAKRREILGMEKWVKKSRSSRKKEKKGTLD